MKGQTFNVEYYSSLLCQLKDKLKLKRLALQDSLAAHKMLNVLKNLGFGWIDHSITHQFLFHLTTSCLPALNCV